MISIINCVFKNKFMSAYFIFTWCLAFAGEIRIESILDYHLFLYKSKGNLSLIQVWHSQCVYVLDFLISQISDNLSHTHFRCIGVWQVLLTKDLCNFLFVFIQTLQILLLIITLTSVCWLWVGFVVSFFFLHNNLTNF